MISIPYSVVEKAKALFPKRIENQRTNACTKLEKLKNAKLESIESDYLNKVIDLFKYTNIITAQPSQLEQWKATIGKCPKRQIMNPNTNKMEDKPVLKDLILKCLGYKELRSSFYPEYFSEIGLKTCVYCNSQLVVVVETKTGNSKAKFQADHYHNKSDYPFLSISLYNLYPACSSCNGAKSTKDVEFELYVKKPSSSFFHFELDKPGLTSYLTDPKRKDLLKVNFTEPPPPADKKTFSECFDIEGIYNTQTDIAEEMVLRARMYNEAYRKSLEKNYKGLFPSGTDTIERILWGNYMKDSDIHKRPMAKFMQDIRKQLLRLRKIRKELLNLPIRKVTL